MRRIRDNLSFLERFKNCSKRSKLVKKASNEQLKCLYEIAKNTLIGNIKLTKSDIAKLKRYKKALKILSVKSKSSKTKRVVLQSGGFLAALASTVIPVLLTFAMEYLRK